MTSLLLLLAGCEPFDLLELQATPSVDPVVVAPLRVRLPTRCDGDGDGAVLAEGDCLSLTAPVDCDDRDSSVYPGAPEWCDGRDSDCDGHIDGPDPLDGDLWFADGDGDGWGAPGTAFRSCRDSVLGAALTDRDCDDTDPGIRPDAPEVCGDGLDQDCDGHDSDLGEEGLACAWVTIDGPAGTLAGAMLGGTGDLSCDGQPDLAIAAPEHGDLGQTRLYPGPFTGGAPPAALATLHDPELGGLSGPITALGDLDGDGCDDAAIGQAPLDGSASVGAWLLFGQGGTDDRLLADGSLVGTDLRETALASHGDLDGDGGADLLVLAPDHATAWLVTALDRGPTALSDSHTTLRADDGLGSLGTTAALGDLDGDGVPELVFGDPAADDGAGRVLVVAWMAGDALVTADDSVLSGRPGAGLGTAVVVAQDLDGDGLDDVVVGAPDEAVAGQDRAGAVRILRGGALANGPSGTLYGRGSERLGSALVAPGNLTPQRDDSPDLIVASGADGSLYWFPRTDAGGMSVPDQLGPSGLGGAGVTLADAGDLDGDGLHDVLVGLPSEDRTALLVAAQFGL